MPFLSLLTPSTVLYSAPLAGRDLLSWSLPTCSGCHLFTWSTSTLINHCIKAWSSSPSFTNLSLIPCGESSTKLSKIFSTCVSALFRKRILVLCVGVSSNLLLISSQSFWCPASLSLSRTAGHAQLSASVATLLCPPQIDDPPLSYRIKKYFFCWSANCFLLCYEHFAVN